MTPSAIQSHGLSDLRASQKQGTSQAASLPDAPAAPSEAPHAVTEADAGCGSQSESGAASSRQSRAGSCQTSQPGRGVDSQGANGVAAAGEGLAGLALSQLPAGDAPIKVAMPVVRVPPDLGQILVRS